MKCKNIECENETKGKNVYCSLTCRNIFVNKYLRNYDKVSDTFKQKKKEKEEKYLEQPKKCLHCNSIILYDNRDNSYCNHSCFAKATNSNREYNWNDKIRESIHKYLIENGIKEEGKIGIYEINCKGCDKTFEANRCDKRYCSENCRKDFKRKNMNDYQKYKSDCNFKFNLKDYSDYFDFKLVEKYGWYSPTNKKNNLKGVSRDHMLSVREGFEKAIDTNLISHPANCELMIHNDNISKNKKSSITIEELINRIKEFEEKYNTK